mmetsp:Transcript_9036/g.10325  ORF Transcript_9036/g.10325 Transcript_9036/m.10325 type:complete len:99 (+) Transcript_9036:234-530(+)
MKHEKKVWPYCSLLSRFRQGIQKTYLKKKAQEEEEEEPSFHSLLIDTISQVKHHDHDEGYEYFFFDGEEQGRGVSKNPRRCGDEYAFLTCESFSIPVA